MLATRRPAATAARAARVTSTCRKAAWRRRRVSGSGALMALPNNHTSGLNRNNLFLAGPPNAACAAVGYAQGCPQNRAGGLLVPRARSPAFQAAGGRYAPFFRGLAAVLDFRAWSRFGLFRRDIFFFLGRGVADMERPAAPSIRPPRSRSAPRCPVSWSSVRRSISRSTSSSSSKSGLNLLTEAKPRKAIVEKAQTPQHSSRTSAIIIALRNRRFRYAERLRVPSKPLAVRRKFALTVGHGQSI